MARKLRDLHGPAACSDEADEVESAGEDISETLLRSAQSIREDIAKIRQAYPKADLSSVANKGIRQARTLERNAATIRRKANERAKSLRAAGASMSPL